MAHSPRCRFSCCGSTCAGSSSSPVPPSAQRSPSPTAGARAETRRNEPKPTFRLPLTRQPRYIAQEPRKERHAVWSMIQAAGWPIWPLIFASVIALALIFERLWSLRQSVVAPSGMVDKVLSEYKRTGLTPELLTKTAHQGPLGRVLAAGLANVKSPRPVMKEAVEEVGRIVSHELEQFLTTLGTIAAMAPLLGLFGT